MMLYWRCFIILECVSFFLYDFVVHVFDDHNDDDDDDFVVLVPVVIFVPLYCRSDINSPFWRAKLPHQTWDLAKELQMKN